MPDLYRQESSNPKSNAQRNLCGRTHYVDDDTLHFHGSRVISTDISDGGLLFAVVTSDTLNFEGTKRGFRFAIFDLFGTALERTDLEGAFRTSAQARKAMWKALEAINAKAVTLAAIQRETQAHAAEMKRLQYQLQHGDPA